jgi:hypothetical protein
MERDYIGKTRGRAQGFRFKEMKKSGYFGKSSRIPQLIIQICSGAFDEENLLFSLLLNGFLQLFSYQEVAGDNKDHPDNEDWIIFLYHSIGNRRNACNA